MAALPRRCIGLLIDLIAADLLVVPAILLLHGSWRPVAAVGLSTLYFVPLVAYGRTLGSLIMKFALARDDGSAPGWWRAAAWWAILIVPLVILPVGAGPVVFVVVIIPALLDSRRRLLNDRLSGVRSETS